MTTHTTLEAKLRQNAGKGFARRTRAEGLIPAVVYGKHLEKPLAVAVDPKGVKLAVQTPKKLNTLIDLKLDGKIYTVLLKDYQQDPLSRELLHADFIDVKETEQVKVKLPIVLTGRAAGIADGGILSQQRREIEVWALPGKIPEALEVDVTNLKIAQALHINDIKLPAGLTVKTHVNYTLAVCVAPEAEVIATPVVAAAVPGAPGAEGAPAAAGAAAAGKPGEAAKPGDKAAPAAAGAPAKKDDKKK